MAEYDNQALQSVQGMRQRRRLRCDLLIGVSGADDANAQSSVIHVMCCLAVELVLLPAPTWLDLLAAMASNGIDESGLPQVRFRHNKSRANDDGFDDLPGLVLRADVTGHPAGQSYVLFGRDHQALAFDVGLTVVPPRLIIVLLPRFRVLAW